MPNTITLVDRLYLELRSPIAPVAIHPYDASLRITATAIRRDRRRSADNGMIPVFMSTAREDRHGSTIRPSAWSKRLDSFRNNPVMQWAHISNIPAVGQALNLQEEGDGWIADLKFATNAWRNYGGGNLAQLLEDLMTDDVLRAVSPGFMPHAFVPRKALDMPQFLDPENVEYTDVELMELSPCNVPSGREALQRSLARGSVSANGLDHLIQLGILPSIFDEGSALEFRSAAPTQERQMTITPAAFATRIADVLTRCCGCDVYREPAPDAISPEEKVADLAAMSTVITAQLTLLDVAMAGWKNTTQIPIRNMFSSIVMSAMYSIEGLIWRAKEWYQTELQVAVPDLAIADLEQLVAGAETITRKAPAAQSAAVAVAPAARANIAALRRTVKAARLSLRDYWMDGSCAILVEECPICWRTDSAGCNCDDAITPADAAIEQATISTLIASRSQVLNTFLSGWTSAEHDALRDFCSNGIYSAMWDVDRLLDFQDFWYPEMEAGEVSEIDPTQMRAFIRATLAAGKPLVRKGAEFSTKNKKTLAGVHDHLKAATEDVRSMLEITDDPADEPVDDATARSAKTFHITVPSPAGSRGADHISITATDAPGAGPGDRSKRAVQPSLYSADTLRVKA
jgi:hypothetical protein